MQNVKSVISMFVPFLWANIKQKRTKERKQAIWLKGRGGIDNNVFKKKNGYVYAALACFLSFCYQLLYRHLSKCIKRSRDSFTTLKLSGQCAKAYWSKKQQKKNPPVVCCPLFLLPHFNRLGNIVFSVETHTVNSLSSSQILASNHD